MSREPESAVIVVSEGCSAGLEFSKLSAIISGWFGAAVIPDRDGASITGFTGCAAVTGGVRSGSILAACETTAVFGGSEE